MIKKHKIKNKKIPVEIVNICENFGFNIYSGSSLFLEEEAMGYMNSKNKKLYNFSERLILVNEKYPVKSRRVLVGQMLGQFLINKVSEIYIDVEDYYKIFNKDEQILNFVLELFMPQREFKKDYLHLIKDNYIEVVTFKLSEKYLVPTNMVELRIKNLLNKEKKDSKVKKYIFKK